MILSHTGINSILLIGTWLSYLLLGNLARVGDFYSTGGFPFIEVLLFASAIIVWLFRRIALPWYVLLIASTVMLSWALGAASNYALSPSSHAVALSYALRLILILVASSLIGWLLSTRLSPDALMVLFRRILLAQVLIGMVLYVIFPNSPDLWEFLRTLGLNFAGDPHERRLLGPQLDPNFFGSILVFGLLLALVHMSSPERSARLWSGAHFLLFCGAIILTVSRSALLGVVVGIVSYQIILFIHSLKNVKQERQLIRGLTTFAWIGIPLVVLLPIFFGDELLRLIARVVTTTDDASALTRLTSTLGAASYLADVGVLLGGVGYNYIPLIVPPDYIVTGFYSSTLNTLVAFGLPLTAILLLLVFAFLYKPLFAMKKQNLPTFAATCSYLAASFVMSWFNNLLYYPLFLLLLLPWIFYWYWYGRFS